MGVLRELRAEAGLTQAQLAERLRRPQSYVSKYETGERRLDLIELEEVANAVGVTLTALVRRYQRSQK
jgi:transcriptional regulator with XRE-family HTH domain